MDGVDGLGSGVDGVDGLSATLFWSGGFLLSAFFGDVASESDEVSNREGDGIEATLEVGSEVDCGGAGFVSSLLFRGGRGGGGSFLLSSMMASIFDSEREKVGGRLRLSSSEEIKPSLNEGSGGGLGSVASTFPGGVGVGTVASCAGVGAVTSFFFPFPPFRLLLLDRRFPIGPDNCR